MPLDPAKLALGTLEARRAPPSPHLPVTPPRHAGRDPPRYREGRLDRIGRRQRPPQRPGPPSRTTVSVSTNPSRRLEAASGSDPPANGSSPPATPWRPRSPSRGMPPTAPLQLGVVLLRDVCFDVALLVDLTALDHAILTPGPASRPRAGPWRRRAPGAAEHSLGHGRGRLESA